jgi:hypothetical protein
MIRHRLQVEERRLGSRLSRSRTHLDTQFRAVEDNRLERHSSPVTARENSASESCRIVVKHQINPVRRNLLTVLVGGHEMPTAGERPRRILKMLGHWLNIIQCA